ncbi:amino acid adenylation domain-containing protein [Micromonospora sp. CPCC 205714]|uniref:amino acid adenylation domain-containing protein n=2 Tax=unclassified Micromonospora TaxID=2617518 RepID=UPI002FF29187
MMKSVSQVIGSVLVGTRRAIVGHSVVHMVREQARIRPGRTALRTSGTTCTFGQLWERVRSVAAALIDQGVAPGDLVAVWASRTPETVAAMLAAMAVRAAYLPLEPTHPAQRSRAIVEVARPRLLVVDRTAVPVVPADLDVPVLDLAEAVALAGVEPGLPMGEDAAYVIFTSGSTGVPKGVVVEHRSLLNYANWCAATVGAEGGAALISSLAFDLSMTALWPQLATGRPVTLCGGVWDHEALFGRRRSPFAYVKVTPSILRFLERTMRPDYRQLARTLVCGGEALDSSLVDQLRDRLPGVRMMNHYGPTEATIGCCAHVFDAGSPVGGRASLPIGRPIWNTRLYVVDDSLDPVPAGRPGELVIAGAGVARGYLHDVLPGAFLDESALGGPPGRAYRTGDQVEVLPDGSLLYLGRHDDQLKISGYRVEGAELRHLALSVPGIADAAVTVAPDRPDELEVHVVLADGVSESGIQRKVQRAIAARVPSAVVPKRVRVVGELTVSVNGKRQLPV